MHVKIRLHSFKTSSLYDGKSRNLLDSRVIKFLHVDVATVQPNQSCNKCAVKKTKKKKRNPDEKKKSEGELST